MTHYILIDDSPIDNFISRKLLESNGYKGSVAEFDSASEALSFFRMFPGNAANIDYVIFLDLRMPEMDGLQFLAEFENLDASIKGRCRIIVLTSSVSQHDMNQARNYASVAGYLSKPLTNEQLSDVLPS